MFCRPPAKALLQGVETRFSNVLNEKKLSITAGLIPFLKFMCLEGQEKEEALRTIKEELGSNEKAPLEKKWLMWHKWWWIYFFYVVKKRKVLPNSDEVNKYLLSTSTRIELLHHLPILKRAFIKANGSLPSSTPVEQLFSVSKDILPPKRMKMSYQMNISKCNWFAKLIQIFKNWCFAINMFIVFWVLFIY